MRLHPFRPRLLDSLRGYDRTRFWKDVSAGITVGVVALPLAMAFAIASGVKPEQGIFTAIVAGFLISALGGSSVQIGGPAGAFIVIVYGIVERYGLTNLLISTALSGVLLFAMGSLRLGVLVRYIPVAIIIGFTNGIAVLIGVSQLKDLFGLHIEKLPADFFTQIGALASHAGSVDPIALAVGLGCLAIVWFWPKSYQAMPDTRPGWARTSRRVASHLPGTIVALVLATLATALLPLPIETIGSRFGGIPQSLPQLALPPFSWASAQQLLIPTLTIALLGAVESLLCARVADNLGEAPRHDPNQELMGLGIANMIAPLFGGIPATGTIARTVTNVRSGATSPVAGIVHAFTLLAVVLVAAPLAAHVPLAGLAGILLFVAWNMGEWREFGRLRRFSLHYRIVMLGTFGLTVVFDLTVAVQFGLVLACVFFIYRMSTLFRVEPCDSNEPGVQVFALSGPLFFGAVGTLEALPARVLPGTRAVVLDMQRMLSMDTSGLDALAQCRRSLARRGIVLMLAALDEQPLSLIRRAGFDAELGAERIAVDRAAAEAAVRAIEESEGAIGPGPAASKRQSS